MKSSVLSKKSKSKVLKKEVNEFESYLQTRKEKTTYNGIELESSNWHKELFGFKK
ncbi:hypothetical protein IJG14_07725 [bacterium]|nr:hypothetical protein [bacterium]